MTRQYRNSAKPEKSGSHDYSRDGERKNGPKNVVGKAPVWLRGLKMWLKVMWSTGQPATWDGRTDWVEKDWIVYKDIYIQICQGDDGGYSLGWQPHAPNHYPLKDMLHVR